MEMRSRFQLTRTEGHSAGKMGKAAWFLNDEEPDSTNKTPEKQE
jgi:hypothetical protein